MNARCFLVTAALWLTIPAVGVAAGPASPVKAASGICLPETPPPLDWLVTDGVFDDYPGIIGGKTKMKLHPHLHPNVSNEWQIEFANESASKKTPPATEVMHLIKVCWKDPGKPPTEAIVDIDVNHYLIDAYNIMRGPSSYYIATGYLAGEPTMMVLVLNEPAKKTETKMTFTLVLVKLDERTLPPAVRQGGVIHGKEN